MLNAEDKMELRKLIDINIKIKEIYDSLREMEINYKTESKIFQNKLHILKKLVLAENKIYEMFKNEPEKIIDAYNKISFSSESLFEMNVLTELDDVANDYSENLVRTRIANHLLNLFLNSDESSMELANMPFNIDGKAYSQIEICIQTDYVNTVLTILNYYINDKKYNSIRNLLLRIKDNYAFLHEEIEFDLLEHNMQINPNLNWKTKIYADIAGLDEWEVDQIAEGLGNEVFDDKIMDIITIEEEELGDIEACFQYYLAQVLVRSSMLFLGEENARYLQDNFKLNATNEKCIVEGEKLTDLAARGQARIDKVLGMYNEDKKLPIIYSTRRNN